MPAGGRIVATASLAGLTAMPDDPVYAAASTPSSVSSVASPRPSRPAASRSTPSAPGSPTRRCSAGRRATRHRRAGFPLLAAADVADAVLARAQLGAQRARVGRPAGPGPGRLPVPERPRRPHGRGRRRPSPATHAVTRRQRSAGLAELPGLAGGVASSGSGGRRPSGGPRRGRRRSGPRGRASPSARAGSRRSALGRRAPGSARSMTSFSTPAA